jgi:hypothetical protein
MLSPEIRQQFSMTVFQLCQSSMAEKTRQTTGKGALISILSSMIIVFSFKIPLRVAVIPGCT